MKVVFISPRAIDTPDQPLGVLYLAAVLMKEGHTVEVIDPDIGESPELIASRTLAMAPAFVGISTTTAQIENGVEIAACIKKQAPSLPVIFGGPHPTVLPAEVLAHNPVDFVAVGEGERIVVNFAKAVEKKIPFSEVRGICWKKDGKQVFNPREVLIQDLDSIPFPARELLNSRYYYAPPRIRGLWTRATATIMASRGCPFKCIWCSSHTVFGYQVRYRSAANVMAELEDLVCRFKVDSVYFLDDTFTLNPKFVTEVCGLIIAKKWKFFHWGCQARVDTVSEEMLRVMKKAGCVQLDFGVESGSPKVLENLKKHITPDKTREAFRLCHKVGMQAFASFMVGTPGETREDILLTQQLIRDIRPDYAEFFYATPYPGTEFFDLAVRRGALPKNISYVDWYASKQIDRPKIHLESSEEDLIRYRSMLHNSVILRNYLTLFKNPSFIIGGLAIFIAGFPGIFRGIARFFRTGKIDNIFVEILMYYRKVQKSKTQN